MSHQQHSPRTSSDAADEGMEMRARAAGSDGSATDGGGGGRVPLSPEDGPILCGLRNLGNTCFANSSIQALTACPQFVAALRLAAGDATENPDLLQQFRQLTRFSSVRQQVWTHTLGTINRMHTAEELHLPPRGVLTAVAAMSDRFATGMGDQHDSVEWVSTLIDALDEAYQVDMNSAPLADALQTAISAAHNIGDSARASVERAYEVFRTLRNIDADNDAEELRLKQRKSPHVTHSGYTPPRLHSSAVGDVFRGMQVTSVTCDRCGNTSQTASEFTSLQLAFPSDADRKAYADHRAQLEAAKVAAASQNGSESAMVDKRNGAAPVAKRQGVGAAIAAAITGVFVGIAQCWRYVWCCIGGGCCVDYGPLTLDELLWLHYRPERLVGQNQYRCQSDMCRGEMRDATKTANILTYPEVLLVQFKRFDYGSLWTSKISDNVEFPMDFVEADAPLPPGATPLTSDNLTPPLDLKPFGVTNLRAPTTSTYSLAAVVNHHGSFFGGHYTAYCMREDGDSEAAANDANGGRYWTLHNDEKTSAAKKRAVSESEVYVLVFHKRRVAPPAPGTPAAPVPTAAERAAARRYLSSGSQAWDTALKGRGNLAFVPRQWLVRLTTHVEPGPVLTQPCYCTDERRKTQCFAHGGDVSDEEFPPLAPRPDDNGVMDRSNRHFHAPARWFYVPVPADELQQWMSKYGADGAMVDHAAMLKLLQAEMRWCGAIQHAGMRD